MLLDPLPSVTNCHTFSDPRPLECDVLYGRPLSKERSSTGRSFQTEKALRCIIAKRALGTKSAPLAEKRST